MTQVSDDRLWQRAQRGDGAAFAELYERHATSVYNFCFRRTGSWSLAEDLTTVVFLEAWRHHDTVSAADGSLLPSLLGVANHAIRHQSRSLQRYRSALSRLPSTLAEQDAADEIAERRRDERAVSLDLARVAALSRPEQEVVALCLWAGLSYAQAATAMRVPVGSIRGRLDRARAKLGVTDASVSNWIPRQR